MDEENRQERISQAAQTALNVSHGVKNLLQAVKGGMEVVDYAFETGDVERAKKGWVILKRNLYRINKLVLDMLTFKARRSLRVVILTVLLPRRPNRFGRRRIVAVCQSCCRQTIKSAPPGSTPT